MMKLMITKGEEEIDHVTPRTENQIALIGHLHTIKDDIRNFTDMQRMRDRELFQKLKKVQEELATIRRLQ